MVFFHQVFGERFRSFQDCRILSWSEYAQSLYLKRIDNTADQRIIHADDGQVNLFFFRKSNELVKLHRCNIDTLCVLRNSCVSRSAVNLVYLRALCHLPGNRMLSSAASYNQYFHRSYSFIFTCPSSTVTFPFAIRSIARGMMTHSASSMTRCCSAFGVSPSCTSTAFCRIIGPVSVPPSTK